jgi:HD-like signal output (HDOD) protein
MADPRGASELTAILGGTDAAWDALSEPVRFRWLAEIQNFPAPPLILELHNGQLSLEQYDPQLLAQHLAADPVLTGRLISRANSAVFGLREPISTLNRALVQLGFSTVRSLVTRYQIELSALRLPGSVRDNIMALQRSAELGATLAYHWACALKFAGPAVVATQCLLSRLGAFLLARHYPSQMDAYFACSDEVQRWDFEAANFGITTRSLTCRVAQLWGFPGELQEALAQLWAPLFADNQDPRSCIACAALVLGFDPPEQAGQLGSWLDSEAHACLRTNLERCGVLDVLPRVVDSGKYRRDLAVLNDAD